MKKTKRRYNSVEEIQADIEKAKKQQSELIMWAHERETFAKLAIASMSPTDVVNGRAALAEVKKARRRAFLIDESKLPKLKRKLAEFQTVTIPGFLPDNSVPV